MVVKISDDSTAVCGQPNHVDQQARGKTTQQAGISMITFELVNHLRLVASYHMGTDLLDRLAHAERVQRQQREALNLAADRIEHLEAEVAKAKAATQAVAHMCG